MCKQVGLSPWSRWEPPKGLEVRQAGRQDRLTCSFFLSTVAKEGLVALQKKLLSITLPDFAGDFKIKPIGRGHYDFHRWGPEVAGRRGGDVEGGEGEPQDLPGPAVGRVPHSVQREVREGGELGSPHSLTHPTNISEDLLAV